MDVQWPTLLNQQQVGSPIIGYVLLVVVFCNINKSRYLQSSEVSLKNSILANNKKGIRKIIKLLPLRISRTSPVDLFLKQCSSQHHNSLLVQRGSMTTTCDLALSLWFSQAEAITLPVDLCLM